MANIFMTGCSTGFGAYVRKQLLEQDHHVLGVGLQGPEVEVDLGSLTYEDAEELVADCTSLYCDNSTFFFPTVLILNAGTTHMDWLENHSAEQFNRVLHVNLTANFYLIKAWHALWLKESSKRNRYIHNPLRVICTGSLGTSMALRTSPGYVASKAGLEAMVRTFAKEWAGKLNAVITTISPGGVVNTKMVDQVISELQRTRGMTREEALAYNTQSPMGRNCTHHEVWQLFNFAVNYMPITMSGEELRMPGGMGIR